MSVPGKPKNVRIEENLGPNRDKHAIVINKYREVHDGPKECVDCRRLKAGEKGKGK